MSINQAKLIKKYASIKKNPFDIKHKCLGDTKLNHQLVSWGESKHLIHGRNLFLFNPYFNSLSTIDHLFLTKSGLILIDFINPIKGIETYDDDWWIKKKTNELIPNPFKEIKRKKEQLAIQLQLQFSTTIPIYEILVSKTELTNGIYTHQTLLPYLESIESQNLLTDHQLQEIQKFILALHENTVETKLDYFDPQMWLNCYCPFGVYQEHIAEHRFYKKLNHFLYDNLSEAVIFRRYRIPLEGIQLPLIDYLVVSKKGALLVNQILDGGKIKEGLNGESWVQETIPTKKIAATKTKLPNLILLSQQQSHGLMECLSMKLNIFYSIFALSPVDLEINHPALNIDLNLEHCLERYLKQHPDCLTLNQFYQLLGKLKQQ